MSAWPGVAACAGGATGFAACAASAAMMAAASAARRSPSALNGVSRAVSPCDDGFQFSFSTRAMTSAWSSPFFWRNSRMVGYQGLSSRLRSQRQSVTHGNSTQTGLPSAPATCATEVSTVMTRSSALIAPRRYRRSPRTAAARSSIGVLAFELFQIGRARAELQAGECSAAHGKQRREAATRSSERRVSLTWSGLPAQTMPIRRPFIFASRLFQRCRRLRRRAQIGNLRPEWFRAAS